MREFVCLSVCLSVCYCAIEMDMEALIKKQRPVLESAHRVLTNRGGLELIGHLFFIDKKLKNLKVGFGNWLAAKNRPVLSVQSKYSRAFVFTS